MKKRSTFGTARLLGVLALAAAGTFTVLVSGPAGALPPGPATHLVVSAVSSTNAGSSISVTVTAKDAMGNTDTSDSRAVQFYTSDVRATLPGNVSLTNGVGTFPVTLRTAGSQQITVTDQANSLTGSTLVNVVPGPATTLTLGTPPQTNDGLPFTFTVSALDQFGNAATSYSGTVHISSSDALATLPANAALSHGTGTFTATLVTTGNQFLAAGDVATPALNGISPAVLVYAVRITGYDLAGADGGVFAIGGEPWVGGLANHFLAAPIVGISTTPDAAGYWLAGADGGVFAFGDAKFYGSMGGKHLNAPIVGIVSTPDGHGYWLVAADGGVFSFGTAQFEGSHGALPIPFNKPVVGIAATPDGKGYWLVAADGGIFAYGDAPYFGSMGDQVLNSPVVGMSRTFDGQGYWLVSADGGVFSFGDAPYTNSLPAMGKHVTDVVGIAGTEDARGYWVVERNGTVTALGDAAFRFGSISGPTDIVGISVGPSSLEQFS